MPPKGKAGDKGKGKDTAGKGKGKAKDDAGDKSGGAGGGKLKAANSINVRHILVRVSTLCWRKGFIVIYKSVYGENTDEAYSIQCEKHSKKEEAAAKLRDGVKFDEVAREFSEDKARQGIRSHFFFR
jgi:peptidyl-prolyl cis-trans isomerase NIMA-interacting 4